MKNKHSISANVMDLVSILIPTDDSSLLFKYSEDGLLYFDPMPSGRTKGDLYLYLCSTLQIKDGDYVLHKETNTIFKWNKRFKGTEGIYLKIELTTDPFLISEGIPAIDGNTRSFICITEYNTEDSSVKRTFLKRNIEVYFLSEFCKHYNSKGNAVIECEMETIKVVGQHPIDPNAYTEETRIKLKDGQPILILK